MLVSRGCFDVEGDPGGRSPLAGVWEAIPPSKNLWAKLPATLGLEGAAHFLFDFSNWLQALGVPT